MNFKGEETENGDNGFGGRFTNVSTYLGRNLIQFLYGYISVARFILSRLIKILDELLFLFIVFVFLQKLHSEMINYIYLLF